ncbi:hypothetical protein [Corynebacterium sp.]|uniref:hypothetical protein n=1 Tax=Corynebacterium sp. TaxID=1720 RepID=UPI0026DC9027|nr:hypothetical protein [Corynebacterium sp.]MDO5032803.1 hypothetical protein [Corynebacterium sp.]
MQIYGYPGDRVDFVSKSGSAGSLLFGDPRSLAEEFFGQPHTSSQDGGEEAISYFSESIVLRFDASGLRAVSIYPTRSKREKVDVYLAKTRLSGLESAELNELIEKSQGRLEVEADDSLQRATFLR